MLVPHPVGVGLEVGQGLVAVGGQAAGEFEAASGGEQGGDVPGVEFGEAAGEPVLAVAAQQPGGEGGQLVDVLAGVVEVGDLGGGGEVLIGQVPDPGRAVTEDDELADVLASTSAASAPVSWPNRSAGSKVAR